MNTIVNSIAVFPPVSVYQLVPEFSGASDYRAAT
jgi:hypothetical protein